MPHIIVNQVGTSVMFQKLTTQKYFVFLLSSGKKTRNIDLLVWQESKTMRYILPSVNIALRGASGLPRKNYRRMTGGTKKHLESKAGPANDVRFYYCHVDSFLMSKNRWMSSESEPKKCVPRSPSLNKQFWIHSAHNIVDQRIRCQILVEPNSGFKTGSNCFGSFLSIGL